MLYLIYPDVDLWNYMLQDYKTDSDKVVIRPLNRYCHKWQMVIRKLFQFKSIPPCLLFKLSFIKEIKSLNQGDSLLICDYADPVLTKAISKLTSNEVAKHFWIWNPITKATEPFYSHSIEVMRNLGFHLSTFDERDAAKFRMKQYNQFFRMKELPAQEEIYDFYFIGFAKDRENELIALQRSLEDMGFKTLFKIVHNNSEAIPYSESIQNILKSKCIVEFVQKDQTGITLRPLEAICFHKKLLTNHCYAGNVLGVDNCMFISEDNLQKDKVQSFLDDKWRDSNSEVIEIHNVSSWLGHFVSKC